MTETAEEKTKRGFIGIYKEHDWHHRTSLFFLDYSQRMEVPEYCATVRRYLSHEYPDICFLWRLVLNRAPVTEYLINYEGEASTVLLPSMTLFSYTRFSLQEFQDFVEQLFTNKFPDKEIPVYCKRNSISNYKYHSYIRAVQTQRPHNLKKYFGCSTNPNRFGMINKSKAIKWEHPVQLLDDSED